MSTHNICFHGEIRKIISELSPNTPPYESSVFLCSLDYGTTFSSIFFSIEVLGLVIKSTCTPTFFHEPQAYKSMTFNHTRQGISGFCPGPPLQSEILTSKMWY